MNELLRTWGQNIERTRLLRNEEGEIRHSNAEPPMSQATLGSLMDPAVSQATVSRWEDGKMEPRLVYKIQIARALGVEASGLFPLPVAVA